MFEFQSLFSEPGQRPRAEEDDPRFPAFQSAWRKGADDTTLFGPKPFSLKGSVGGSGADNFRPDVAKVETFLNRTGHYKPLTEDGPGGYHSDSLDRAIKGFQKENGLQIDGLLKPDGPTIGALGRTIYKTPDYTGARPSSERWPKPQANTPPSCPSKTSPTPRRWKFPAGIPTCRRSAFVFPRSSPPRPA